MTNTNLLRAMGRIDPRLIADAATDALWAEGVKEPLKERKRTAKKRWMGAVAAMLAVAVLAGVFLRPGVTPTAYAIAEAKYPEMAPYPGEPHTQDAFEAWWESTRAQQRDLGDTSALRSFFARSAGIFLTGDEGQNRVYSPLNVYMALAMLAQLTGGESREQILTLLGSGSMDALRTQANDVWNSNYRDDGALTSILASSLWLNQGVKFNQATMDTLARDFYASSYRGEMGSEAFNGLLQGWLNEQTGGLLEEQAGSIELKPETILALATTVYFRGKWYNEFSKEDTTTETFHTPSGDVEADFMRQRSFEGYYWGDRFTAVSKSFAESGMAWFILPDEGITAEALLADSEIMDFLFFGTGSYGEYEWENQKALFVNESIPKFDVSSQFELTDGLRALGITDVFDPAVSDFTPMTTDVDVPIAVSQANHAARVVIDEEGCTAAAFTVMMPLSGDGRPPDEEVDFILDRPFLFCITGISGLPLFVGIVNYPLS